ncbi:hypothetical protein [Pseudophaeobacter flagellatus]|uniref:hypothetical protein n=1 Tax=Pseudophaeobacter flagellatus TaxID=2899119 RepID=UPI001E36B14E|nr:hypothetical protein [Pseudophaeobacter flagellatus]MCD9146750.1 hypothetical protein [Pseudophaeobacter flagellatus]
MPEPTKTFSYQVDGLSYTVTLYEENGSYFADITVDEGAMDVNAIYFGDDDQSGTSESLNGPLNLNGTRLDGESIQWDEAVTLSDPGLGPEGDDKDTYLTTGDTLTVSLDVESLEDIDIFGIRATSTSTDAGSIKAVSDDPEDPPEEPEDPTYEKIFFGEVFSDAGDPIGGTFILDEAPDPNTYSIPALPEGTDPTFENYLSFFQSDEVGGDLSEVQSIVFYGTDAEGNTVEDFRLDAPDGGFQDADQVLAAYDDAILSMEEQAAEPETNEGEDLISALSLEETPEEPPTDPEFAEDDGFELV